MRILCFGGGAEGALMPQNQLKSKLRTYWSCNSLAVHKIIRYLALLLH
jgi:hypothetical protein